MTVDDFLANLANLNAPDQGMRYHSGGHDASAPAFDERTGKPLPPVFRPAELTVYGERARFIYAVIEGCAELSAALRAQPQAREEAQPVAWRFRDHPNNGWVYTGLGGRHDGCEVQPLYTTPPTRPLAEGADAEKLRVAVEALEGAKQIASRLDGHDAEMMADEIEAIDQALAALQQEGQ